MITDTRRALEPLNRLSANYLEIPVFAGDVISAGFSRLALRYENQVREAIGLASTTWATARTDADALTPAQLAAGEAWLIEQEIAGDTVNILGRL